MGSRSPYKQGDKVFFNPDYILHLRRYGDKQTKERAFQWAIGTFKVCSGRVQEGRLSVRLSRVGEPKAPLDDANNFTIRVCLETGRSWDSPAVPHEVLILHSRKKNK